MDDLGSIKKLICVSLVSNFTKYKIGKYVLCKIFYYFLCILIHIINCNDDYFNNFCLKCSDFSIIVITQISIIESNFIHVT